MRGGERETNAWGRSMPRPGASQWAIRPSAPRWRGLGSALCHVAARSMNQSAKLRQIAKAALVVLRASCAFALAALVAFCVPRAPRGFALFSWSFFEHQLFPPMLSALGFAGALATLGRWQARYALRDAFWGVSIPLSLAVAVFGNTRYAFYFVAVIGLALCGLLVPRIALSRWVPPNARVRVPALATGAASGALFLFATWAPRPSTHPVARDAVPVNWSLAAPFQPDTAATLAADGFRVRVIGGGSTATPVTVEAGGKRLEIEPAFELTSHSRSGLWTVFDYQREVLPGWEIAALDTRTAALRAQSQLLSANVLVRIENGLLTVRSVTLLRREVCVHLAHALVLGFPARDDFGAVRVDGYPFRTGSRPRLGDPLGLAPPDAVEFVAYRSARLELLRANHDEKGPFTTLATLADHDPVLSGSGFRIEIKGFAGQSARAPSPTAGFGVSQAALDASYDQVRVELAATAIGRGFNTVRIAPGTYELTVVVSAEH
jgi:hypothetical protein